jgi:hypothetical protein
MSLEKLIKEFGAYLNDCKILVRDLELVISDLEYEKNENGTIQYAIDCGEIWDYTLPYKPDPNYLLFDDDWEEATNFKLLLLSNIFYNAKSPLILLEPYSIELKAFLDGLKLQLFHAILKDIVIIFNESKELLGHLDIKKYAEIDIDALSDVEKNEILRIFEQHAPTLLTYFEPLSEPLRRVYGILKHCGFVGLDKLGLYKLEPDKEISERWFDKLMKKPKRRGESPASSKHDSDAMAILEYANRILGRKKSQTRLLLITKSSYMEDILRSEIENGGWPQEIGNIIRHPRTINLRVGLYQIGKDNQILELKNQKKILDDFIQLTEPGFKDIDSETIDNIYKGIRRIKEYWRNAENLSASLSFPTENYLGQPNIRLKDKPINAIFQAIKTNSGLKQLIAERIEELETSIEREQNMFGLGLFFENIGEREQSLLKSVLRVNKRDAHYEVYTSPQAMPYRLVFYSKDIQRRINDGDLTENISWRTITSFLKNTIKTVPEYERNLAIALLLATLNNWEFAERYCDKAIEQKDANIEEVPIHEALFLKAICQRKWQPNEDRYRSALKLLEAAAKSRNTFMKQFDYLDPRYLAEEGCQILLLNLNCKNSIKAIPSPDKGLELLKKAQGLANNDVDLILRTWNNRLYYCFVAKYIDRGALIDEFNHFAQYLKTNLIENKWPAYILDTVAWLEWNLFENISAAEEKKIIERFKRALCSYGITKEEIREIQLHLDEIQNGEKSNCRKFVI